jgi:protein-disulfide isomerase
MPKNRLAVLVLMLIATSVFLVTAVRRAARRTSGESGRAAEFLDVTRDAAMGTLPHTRGEASAPYVVVEFADYQCPPCKAENLTVARLLARYHTHVRLVFRNYPLAMHPYAE